MQYTKYLYSKPYQKKQNWHFWNATIPSGSPKMTRLTGLDNQTGSFF
jgi:hypothetical protein